MQVEPLRDCCVNAYELFGSEEWRLKNRNLSGTAGDKHSSQRFLLSTLRRDFFCLGKGEIWYYVKCKRCKFKNSRNGAAYP